MHLSETLSLVVIIVTFVDVTALPLELAVTIFLISFIFAFELITYPHASNSCIVLLLTPFAFSMLHSVEEFSCIGVAVGPFVLAKAIRVPIAILPNILVAVSEEV